MQNLNQYSTKELQNCITGYSFSAFAGTATAVDYNLVETAILDELEKRMGVMAFDEWWDSIEG